MPNLGAVLPRLTQPNTLTRNASKLARLQVEVFVLLRDRLETILAVCGFHKPAIAVGSEQITVGPLNTLARPETTFKYAIEINREIDGPLRPAPAENWRHGLQVPVPDPSRTPVSHDVRMQLYQAAKTHLPELLQAWEGFEKNFLETAVEIQRVAQETREELQAVCGIPDREFVTDPNKPKALYAHIAVYLVGRRLELANLPWLDFAEGTLRADSQCWVDRAAPAQLELVKTQMQAQIDKGSLKPRFESAFKAHAETALELKEQVCQVLAWVAEPGSGLETVKTSEAEEEFEDEPEEVFQVPTITKWEDLKITVLMPEINMTPEVIKIEVAGKEVKAHYTDFGCLDRRSFAPNITWKFLTAWIAKEKGAFTNEDLKKYGGKTPPHKQVYNLRALLKRMFSLEADPFLTPEDMGKGTYHTRFSIQTNA